MRILILANNDVGLYKFRRELVEELLKEHEVYICLPQGEFIDKFVDIGCKYLPCEFSRHGMNLVKELQLLLFYRKVIKDYNPGIVFTYTIKPNVYGGMACSSLKVPYVVNITGLGTAVENEGFLQKITVFLYKLSLKKAQKVFFQNSENQEFMLNKGVVKGEYGLLPGSGVNLKQYKLLEYPCGETVDFVFVARIMKEKGIEQYLDAAVEIRKKHPETRFHVCGFCEQAYEERLNELAEKEVIIYHGLVKDMLAIYAQTSCTIHPTYYPEGLSNVLLESSACGRPIITTNRSGCREVVEDGKNGFIVEEKSSSDLINKIEIFLAKTVEERRQMGLAGRKKVEKEFDRKIVIEKYLMEIKGI